MTNSCIPIICSPDLDNYSNLITVGMTDLLNFEDSEFLTPDDCAHVIKYMANHYEVPVVKHGKVKYELEHIKYLLVKDINIPGSGVAVTLSCDLSVFHGRI